jgi:hypothetical protein
MVDFETCTIKIETDNVITDIFNPFKNSSEYISTGTGFFIDTEGHILTCSHVVEHAIAVYFSIPRFGKKMHVAKILSICPELDVALLKTVGYKPQSFYQLNTGITSLVGARVSAIGYPLSADSLKITNGTISGYDKYNIQTDAPINPGNSGGPLINNDTNNVVGINSSKSVADDVEGTGFALPIHFVNDILQKMKSGKELIIYKPTPLCHFDATTSKLIKHCNIDKYGARLRKLHKQSVFSKAGLHDGDILYRIGKMKVDKYCDIKLPWAPNKISIHESFIKYNIGDVINVKYYSCGDNIKKNANVILEQHKLLRKYYNKHDKLDFEIISGIVMTQLTVNHITEPDNHYISTFRTTDLVNYYNNDKRPTVLISNILNGSYMRKLKVFVAGERIVKVDDHNVSTINDIRLCVIDSLIVKKNKYVTLHTNEKSMVALDIKCILNDNIKLHELYKYTHTILNGILLEYHRKK